MSSNNELYNCDDTQYYASVEAEGSAIIPLSGTIVTATATSSATSGFSYDDAYEIANILAQQIADVITPTEKKNDKILLKK